MYVRENQTVTDKKWVRQAFFKRKLGGAGANSASMSESFNFYDTTLGGNRALNPAPQYTRWSDPKINTVAQGCKSMGEYYKRAHDDNEQRISLQFGIPEYNSLSTFMANFYDTSAARLARFGDASNGLLFSVGNTVGTLFTLPLQAFFGLNYMFNRISATISGNPYSKFYYLNPNMATYWNAVTLMFNKIATDMGALDHVAVDDLQVTDGVTGRGAGNLADLSSMMPDVLFPTGNGYSIDVKSIAGKSQRLANEFNAKLLEIDNKIGATGLEGQDAENAYRDELLQLRRDNAIKDKRTFSDYPAYLAAYQDSPLGDGQDVNDFVPELDDTTSTVKQPQENAVDQVTAGERGVFKRFEDIQKFVKAELQEGSAFVTFNVNKTGTISHSFSNSTKAAPVKEASNSMASSARDLTVNLFGGNLTDNFVGNAIESVATGVKDLLSGGLDSIGLSGFNAVASGAMMDMSDVYEDSSADLGSTQYTMRLATPYGNKFSILTRIYLPLCCLLAGILPRRTGKNSYTSPFLCRLHSQGMEEIKLGIMKDLSIEIASSNIGRSTDGLPTAIDVSFTIESMDKMMSMPLTDSILDSVTSFSAFDEDSTFSDFLTTLAGTSLEDQFFAGKRISRAWKKTMADWNSFATPSYFAQWFGTTTTGSTISSFLKYGDI